MATFTNPFVGIMNKISGNHLGQTPTYSNLWDAIFNQNPRYSNNSNPNGYVPTYVLRGEDSPSFYVPSSANSPSLVDALLGDSPSNPVVPGSPRRRSYSGSIPGTAPNYVNAPLASHYGMDAATAYQEALVNTAHQREIKDLQAAGLNPVLSARYGGAGSVSGAQAISFGSSGSSGGYSVDATSPIAQIAGGIVGIVTGSSAKSNATEKLVSGLGSVVGNFLNSGKSLSDLVR